MSVVPIWCKNGALVFLVACCCVQARASEQIDPKDPPHGRFSDEWVEIHIGGGKVGYGHMSMTREGDRIRTENRFHMKLGRAEQTVEIDMEQHTVETLGGRPISFGSEMDASVMKTATRGTIKDGRVTIVTAQFGMEQKQEFDYPKGALMSWGLFRESLIRGFEPGTEYTLTTYAPELRLDDAVKAITKIGGFEEFDLHGQRVMLQRVTVTLESPLGSMEMVSWIDETARPIRAKIPAPGIGDMIMIASDQASAMADFVPPEIFMTTALKAGRKIDRAKVKRIVYRLKPKGNEADAELDKLPTTGMQNVQPKGSGAVEVVVTRQSFTTPASKQATPDRAAMSEYVDTNLMVNTDDPQLKALAKRAGGSETDPYKLADKLRCFVTDYVEHKNLNIGFATASEVCRTKEGDCSEHAVLLAALGRVNGLPSRVVAGLAYVPLFGNQDDIFGYHMWTQFFIDGRWVDVDAALRETECSPARIAFAVSSLKHSGLADLSFPLISKIGAIDLEIVSAE